MKLMPAALLFAIVVNSCSGGQELNYKRLNRRAATEYLVPVRPFEEGKQQCWNHWAKDFKFAPVFDFVSIDGASSYRYTVWQDTENSYYWTTPMMQRPDDKFPAKQPTDTSAGFFNSLDITASTAISWSFVAKTPNESLTPVWEKIPVGNCRLIVEALDAKGNVLGVAGDRLFIRDFPFEGPYPESPRPYREAALKAAMYVHTMPSTRAWLKEAEPDPGYTHNLYACKIIGSTIRLEIELARLAPTIGDECLTIARNAAEFLVSHSMEEGSPLAYFPPTYYKKDSLALSETSRRTTMMMEASTAAQAFLDLYDYTGEEQWLTQALKIAGTYEKLQAPDGSFPVKVKKDSAEPTSEAHAMLHPLLTFLERLQNQYGIDDFADVQAKGEDWMRQNALRTLDMRGQFEDVSVLGWKPYQNMTNATAGPYASYLLRKREVSKSDLCDAKDLLRLCEDQFVHWNALPNRKGFRQIHTPGVYEQYEYRVPIDCSNCNVANAWLDLYDLNGDKLAYAKAKALADAIAIVQDPINGQIPTTWDMRSYSSNVKRAWWINCTYASVMLLLRMEQYNF